MKRNKILGFKVNEAEEKELNKLIAQFDRDNFSSVARYILLGIANGKLTVLNKK